MGEMLVSKILKEIEQNYSDYAAVNSPSSLKIKKGDLDLEIYDDNNLVGFKLTGTVGRRSILVVHDSDNYDRNNPEFKELYDDVEKDIRHIVKVYINNAITVEAIVKKKLWKKKQSLYVVIPNAKGERIKYDALTVNTTNFFE